MVSPVAGETFSAPATLRLIAAAHDPNVFINSPRDGLGGTAAKVQFFVDEALVLEVDGSRADYFVFKGFVDGIAAGRRRASGCWPRRQELWLLASSLPTHHRMPGRNSCWDCRF